MKRFSVFFEENYSLVVAVAANRLGSRQDGEEIATEAFRIVWEHYKSGETLSKPWLYGVVRNLVGTEYRRRARRADLAVRLDEDQELRTALVDDLYMDLRDAVERLPLAFREVIKMTYWDGLTSREIGDVLGIGAPAVRARLMRARRMLGAALSEMEAWPDLEVKARE